MICSEVHGNAESKRGARPPLAPPGREPLCAVPVRAARALPGSCPGRVSLVADEDEEALSWLGEGDDPAALARPNAARARSSRSLRGEVGARNGLTIDSSGIDSSGIDDEGFDEAEFDSDDDVPRVSSLALVSGGVLAGIYFLCTLGWLNFAIRSASSGGDPLADAMFNIGLWLAVLAAPLWFGVTFWLVQRPALRFGLLALGVLVLIPIPTVWPR